MLIAFLAASFLVGPCEGGSSFASKPLIYEGKSGAGEVKIFETPQFGKVFSCDGVVQFTEKDEFIRSEMMAHIPLIGHPNPRVVLILGGSSGGILREVLKYEHLEKVVQVEEDVSQMELSKKYIPEIAQDARKDPKVCLISQPPSEYLAQTKEKFDVIICDLIQKPSKEVPWDCKWYSACKKVLNPHGILVHPAGIPFLDSPLLAIMSKHRRASFKQGGFYIAPMPSRLGGFHAFGWACDRAHRLSEKTLRNRLHRLKGPTRYYTPAIHKAAFVLPAYMAD